MNGSPLVSIILPTHNRAGLIMETIESVLGQTYENWELIIVDDGSDDNTEEIVSGLGDRRIQFHKTGRMGVGIRLRTIGIKEAHGELFCFIDSDDCWAPTKLEKQIDALERYPAAGFSLTGAYDFRKKGEPLHYYYRQKSGEIYGDLFISFFKSEVSLPLPSIMFRKECLPLIYDFAVTTPGSDVEFMYGLALHFKAVILFEPLLYRRLHDNNYSLVNWERGFEEGIRVIKKYKMSGMLPTTLSKQSLYKLYINYGEEWLLRDARKKAINRFFQAWTNKPLSLVPFKKTGKAILQYFK